MTGHGCNGPFHRLTELREGRSPSPARCRCGRPLQLPDAPPPRVIDVRAEVEPGIGITPQRMREIQRELNGKVWR